MTWPELVELAADPRVTIGARIVNHQILAKCAHEIARREIAEGVDRIAQHMRRRPEHFSYPVGDPASAGPHEFDMVRDVGFKTAVTTRPGVLFPGASRSSAGAAAAIDQWRLSGSALCRGASLRYGDRPMEPVSPTSRAKFTPRDRKST